MASTLSIGLIGLGDMGRGHLECLKSFPSVRLNALCDLDSSRLQGAFSSLFGKAKVYPDYRSLLDQKEIDAVFISVPDDLHAEVALAALDAGKHVFLEKPLANSLKNGERLLKAASQSNKIFFVGHIYRFSPFFRELLGWIDQDIIGKPMMLWCHEFRQPFPQRDWFYDSKKTGGTFVEKNCHHFDLFNWITNDRAKKVVAFGGIEVLKTGVEISCSYCPDPPKKMEHASGLDHGWAMVEYEKGAKANLGLCMFLEKPDRIWRGLELGIIGTNGKMLVTNVDFGSMTLFGGDKKEEKKEVVNPNQGVWHSGMREEHEAFIQAVLQNNKTQSLETVKWALEAIRIGLAAEESVKKGKIISL